MHTLVKHLTKIICNTLFTTFLLIGAFLSSSFAEQSVEEIIKTRQSIFSNNYKVAKRVNSLVVSEDFDEAKQLMNEMSENYKKLLNLFPDNTQEGFETEALPSIWENKDEFNTLMSKASSDMLQLVSVIEDTDDINGTLGKFMWGNCKACHNKFRAEH
ncbi:MAG: c-type cytochrome [Candidatus Pelagibacter sp.]